MCLGQHGKCKEELRICRTRFRKCAACGVAAVVSERGCLLGTRHVHTALTRQEHAAAFRWRLLLKLGASSGCWLMSDSSAAPEKGRTGNHVRSMPYSFLPHKPAAGIPKTSSSCNCSSSGEWQVTLDIGAEQLPSQRWWVSACQSLPLGLFSKSEICHCHPKNRRGWIQLAAVWFCTLFEGFPPKP